MAQDKKISELDTSGTLTGAETLVLVQSGTTFKSLLSAIYTYFETTFKAATLTLTNKRITKRVLSQTTAASITPDLTAYNSYVLTAMSGDVSVGVPTGTPTNLEEIEFLFTDNGVVRNITWDGIYADGGTSLIIATTAGKAVYTKFVYNSTLSKYLQIISFTQI